MKILLTGAAGFLGKRIAHSLLAQGASDIRLHFRQDLPECFVQSLTTQFPHAHIECTRGNLLSRGGFDAMVQDIDCVIHSAAGMRGAAADMFANTVLGTRNLLEAAVARGVKRIVLIGSFAVYKTEALPTGALLAESTPIEEVGTNKGPYGYAKTRQERLFLDMAQRHGFETVILRPGVIYGPGGSAFSSRVGIKAMGLFFALGGDATLPLTYVDNCADAVVQATLRAPAGGVFNVVDEDLPSCRQYLQAYQKKVRPFRTVPVPYWAFLMGSRYLARYHRSSKGQLPAVFTPYVVRSMYRPLRYSNASLRAIGWRQAMPTTEALELTFRWLRDHDK